VPFVNRVIIVGKEVSFMLLVLRPHVARLAQWNLVPGALAIAAVAL
jgi:hypothetical protein